MLFYKRRGGDSGKDTLEKALEVARSVGPVVKEEVVEELPGMVTGGGWDYSGASGMAMNGVNGGLGGGYEDSFAPAVYVDPNGDYVPPSSGLGDELSRVSDDEVGMGDVSDDDRMN
jgi:hypothetical protein